MIAPIQTHYSGYHFRSRLEARWARAAQKSTTRPTASGLFFLRDEIILEVPDRDADHARERLTSHINAGTQKIIAAVRIEVEAVVADCWTK